MRVLRQNEVIHAGLALWCWLQHVQLLLATGHSDMHTLLDALHVFAADTYSGLLTYPAAAFVPPLHYDAGTLAMDGWQVQAGCYSLQKPG